MPNRVRRTGRGRRPGTGREYARRWRSSHWTGRGSETPSRRCSLALLATRVGALDQAFTIGGLFDIAGYFQRVNFEGDVLELQVTVAADQEELKDVIHRPVGLVLPSQLEARHQAIDVCWGTGQK